MQLITVKSFNTAIEAHIAKNKLDSEGIPSFIMDEHIVSLDPLLNFAVGGVRLQVNQEDLENARFILSEIDGAALTNEQNEVIECPNCASSELYADFSSMKSPGGFLAMISAFVFTVFPIYRKSVYKCKVCGTEFDKP